MRISNQFVPDWHYCHYSYHCSYHQARRYLSVKGSTIYLRVVLTFKFPKSNVFPEPFPDPLSLLPKISISFFEFLRLIVLISNPPLPAAFPLPLPLPLPSALALFPLAPFPDVLVSTSDLKSRCLFDNPPLPAAFPLPLPSALLPLAPLPSALFPLAPLPFPLPFPLPAIPGQPH